jgi:hypothetical protein
MFVGPEAFIPQKQPLFVFSIWHVDAKATVFREISNFHQHNKKHNCTRKIEASNESTLERLAVKCLYKIQKLNDVNMWS